MIDYQIPAKFIQENSFLVQAKDGNRLAGEAREFNNLNAEVSFGYKKYTDKIPDEKIISFEENRLRFRP